MWPFEECWGSAVYRTIWPFTLTVVQVEPFIPWPNVLLLNTLLLITPCELKIRRMASRLSLSFFSASENGIKWTAWRMRNWNTFIFRQKRTVYCQSFWKLSPVLNSVLYIIPGSEFGEHHFLHRLTWGYSDKALYSIGFILEAILQRLCYIAYYPKFLKNTLSMNDFYDWICQNPKKIEAKRNKQW